jgi:NAD(P)-dependent dehydrogenase (short-subunit alcohol dehydrogenase family)
MTADMADEAEKFNIAVISLYPGLVRTESVLRAAEYYDEQLGSPRIYRRGHRGVARTERYEKQVRSGEAPLRRIRHSGYRWEAAETADT